MQVDAEVWRTRSTLPGIATDLFCQPLAQVSEVAAERHRRKAEHAIYGIVPITSSSVASRHSCSHVRFVRCQVAEIRKFIERPPQRPKKGRNQAFAEALYV
jgi:hypothetical protein